MNLALELLEERMIHFIGLDGTQTQLELFEHIQKLLSIYQLDWRQRIPTRG